MEENKEIDFEETMKNLETIAKELENGDLDLNTSMKKFEEGMELSKKCNEILEKAEKKITILLENNGELEEKDFTEENN